jgi:hypothetical protein
LHGFLSRSPVARQTVRNSQHGQEIDVTSVHLSLALCVTELCNAAAAPIKSTHDRICR